MMYKIYRIPDYVYPDGSVGKIGVSKDIKRRMVANKRTSQSPFDFWEILEEHSCAEKASIREIELQKQYGYKVDITSYSHSSSVGTKKQKSLAGKKGGTKYRPIGTLNASVTLNEDKVRYIRKWCKQKEEGPYSQRRMAKAMGITQSAIANIIARRTWKHI